MKEAWRSGQRPEQPLCRRRMSRPHAVIDGHESKVRRGVRASRDESQRDPTSQRV